MAVFEIALALILKHEGGFVNNPADKGQATNYGISTPTLSRYIGRPATVDDVKNITQDTVKTIYRLSYWNVIKGDAIAEQSIASFLMDMAVLMGPASAVRLAQTALGLKSDGIIGPLSLAKLNGTDPCVFALVFSKACIRAFINIAVNNPSQLQFLQGWVRRADEMTDLKVA